MLFVCICHLLRYTAKIKIHGFLVLTLAKGSHINAAGSEAREHTGSCTAPNSSYREAPVWPLLSQVAIQKGNSQTDSYHIPDEKRNSFRVKTVNTNKTPDNNRLISNYQLKGNCG